MDRIENICIFVVDSLRWDSIPETATEHGIAFKTVSQSLYSAPSFSTLSTGLYPQEHGVSKWEDQIPTSVQTIYDIPGTDCGFYQPGDPQTEAIFSVLRRSEARPLSSLSPPFVYLERNTDPHPPLADFSSVEEYYQARKQNWNRVRNEYEQGIRESLSLFESRVEELDDRGLLDSTLIIITSDHGELFGEYGEVGHAAPAVPETVYVPSVFIHPELDIPDFQINPDEEIIEHVDVIATALTAANHENITSGTDILSEPRSRSWGYNRYENRRRGMDFYTSDSIWWSEGGYNFLQNPRYLRALYAGYRLFKGAERHALRWNLTEIGKTYLPRSHEYGNCPITESRAQKEVRDFVAALELTKSEHTEIDSNTEKRLKELGYLDT